MPADRQVVLLGPQRHDPTLRSAVDALGVRGRLAAVTAGWEEREDEDTELADHLGGTLVNLRIFERVEAIYARDPELHQGTLQRHDRLTELADLYRLRLAATLQAARELIVRGGDEPSAVLRPEIDDAIQTVRALDQRHLARVGEVHAEFEARWRPADRPAVARARAEVRAQLAAVDGLCIAGGHVGVLHNRMRLLDVLPAAADLPVFAWSAGAMLLTEQVVLFHDSPPQGAGNAEVFGPGFGLCQGVVVLPHAARRLRLDDRDRVALLAQRFAPARCAAFDPGAQLSFAAESPTPGPGTRALTVTGLLRDFAEAAA